MTRETPRTSEPGRFEARHAIWAMLHACFGPARSYPYAWRLPELARGEDAQARRRAGFALALTLYSLGRFDEARSSLPTLDGFEDDDPELVSGILDLRARCLWLGGEGEAARVLAATVWDGRARALTRLRARAYFHYLADDPRSAVSAGMDYHDAARAAGSPADQSWAALLVHWARARSGLSIDPAAAHTALAALSDIAPSDAAHGAALHAEAMFRQDPVWSLVWLDEALDQGERYGQHHLKSRLLHLKARSLESAGMLGEAGRFMELARDIARRQGAWRYGRDMAA